MTVNTLKFEYRRITGNDLIIPGALSCNRNEVCYYNMYASAYDAAVAESEKKKIDAEMKARAEKEAACDADVKCKREKEVESSARDLNQTYMMVLAQNPYQQDGADGAVRIMCRKAGEAQRNGMSLKELSQRLDLTEGIAPQTRYYIKNVAKACWNLSANGVPNGNVKIKSGY